jgi:hypothetical protein
MPEAITREHVKVQLAMFMQARDARRLGAIIDGVAHPTWEEASVVGQDEYLADAAAALDAVEALGYWSPGTQSTVVDVRYRVTGGGCTQESNDPRVIANNAERLDSPVCERLVVMQSTNGWQPWSPKESH